VNHFASVRIRLKLFNFVMIFQLWGLSFSLHRLN
jgi:hypothetical protein